MSILYGYKNQLWKEIHHFTYTGSPEEFTLNPGTYLLICNGARGGYVSSVTSYQNHGGTSYGVLTLTEPKILYAVVGGDGEPGVQSTNTGGAGGYNGGGTGGKAYSNSYMPGPGGGGASDIRLSPDTTHLMKPIGHLIPDDYEPLEYIESSGDQWIDTGIAGNSAFNITFDIQYLERTNRQLMGIGLLSGEYFGLAANYEYEMSGHITGTDGRNRGIITYHHPNTSMAYLSHNDMYTSDGSATGSNAPNTLKIFSVNNSSYATSARLYQCYVMNIDNTSYTHYFIPVRNVDTDEIGLYDIITETFFNNESETPFIAGDPINPENIGIDLGEKGLYTRIIVAGGGGGGRAIASNTQQEIDYAGIGGGVVGGCITCNTAIADYQKHATQMLGASFGIGATAIHSNNRSTRIAQGRGGGGGGWYGGYAIMNNSSEYSSSSGGGGSGYVLTESSYKPEGYIPDEEYYMTNTFMSSGHAESASVIVCQLTSTIKAGDTIIIPPTGETNELNIPGGEYIFKCWGASGGIRNLASDLIGNNTYGGYAQGTLNILSPVRLYCNVGGSGLFDSLVSDEYVHNLRPEINFNGGGLPINYGVYQNNNGHSGGGATDIRIDSDSLYARVIVAGGAGGASIGATTGGAGGGLSGGGAKGSNGTNPGPGTQTETPSSIISYQYGTNGEFGIGGNAYNSVSTGLSGNSGGAGGGGWYGGNGSYVTASSGKSGSGGSGYVLTESSYKPEGYLLGSKYYLDDTILMSGDDPLFLNKLFFGETRIEIEVVDVLFIPFLAKDSEGIKAYDSENAQWHIIDVEEIDSSTFEEYGVLTFSSLEGLQDQFELLIYDAEDAISDIVFNVSPNAQMITNVTTSNMSINGILFDEEHDPSIYDIDLSHKRFIIETNTEIETKIVIDKIDTDSSEKAIIYSVSYLSQNID